MYEKCFRLSNADHPFPDLSMPPFFYAALVVPSADLFSGRLLLIKLNPKRKRMSSQTGQLTPEIGTVFLLKIKKLSG
jgi:hypothetical protein